MMHLPFKYGIVSDSKPGYAKVFFQEDDLVTDWWPVLVRTSLKDKESWPLNAQEHVVCLCDHRLEEGVVLGAIHNDEDTPDPGAAPGKFRQVFEDGTTLEYDKGSHELKAMVVGKATVTATIKASITAPEIDVIGNLSITGNLAFSGTMSGGAGGAIQFDGSKLTVPALESSGDVKSGTVSLSAHTHSGVTTGAGSSGPPVH
jgi:phage baseplate assembly protein V